jgi:putative PIN family toxin of toxin-antitoxin system
MKIVCDSNVLISGMLFPGGPPDKIIQSAISGQIENHISPDILTEIQIVLTQKFHLLPKRLDKIIELISDFSIMTYPKIRLTLITKDPNDNRILECAREANVDYIVTGDKKHLIPLKRFNGIPIVLPNQFLIQAGII